MITSLLPVLKDDFLPFFSTGNSSVANSFVIIPSFDDYPYLVRVFGGETEVNRNFLEKQITEYYVLKNLKCTFDE